MNVTKGYSLAEVLISLSVLLAMAGIASTSFLKLSPKYRLKKAAWEINSQMNYARYKAIFYGEKFRIRFGLSDYNIEKYDENLKDWVLERKYLCEGVTILANNTPTFHPGGTVSNLASIFLSNSWGEYKITLAISGRIKILKL